MSALSKRLDLGSDLFVFSAKIDSDSEGPALARAMKLQIADYHGQTSLYVATGAAASPDKERRGRPRSSARDFSLGRSTPSSASRFRAPSQPRAVKLPAGAPLPA